MTKNLGTDYDQPAEQRKPGRALGWAFDLLFPLVLVGAALVIGRYGWPF